MAYPGHSPHPTEAIAEEDHIGPWPAFVDLFAATSLIMLVFFAVIGYLYIREKGSGIAVQPLYTALDSLAKQRNFSVRRDGPDVLIILEEDVTFPRNRSALADLKEPGRVALIGIGNLIGSRRFRALVREVEVVGHADQSQYRPELGLSNWSISAARAATVAEFLVKNTELSPCIVIPSGRADYFPRDAGVRARTEATDAADRRIELLLHPVVQGDTTQGRRPGCRTTRK